MHYVDCDFLKYLNEDENNSSGLFDLLLIHLMNSRSAYMCTNVLYFSVELCFDLSNQIGVDQALMTKRLHDWTLNCIYITV
jgi:hypothetical protein